MITELKDNQVFCFGANFSGFHGAGSAGYAFRGTTQNTWRQDSFFLEALRELNKKNSGEKYNKEKLIGKWAVLGKCGAMQGKEGKSYGIVTTEKAGLQGFVDDAFLMHELVKFTRFALTRPKLQFLVVPIGLKRPHGYSWWSAEQMLELWRDVFVELGLTTSLKNVKLPDYHQYIE